MLTIIATFLVSFAIVFLIFPHHKPSGWVSFVYVIMAFPILYFVNGLVRYLTISRAVLS